MASTQSSDQRCVAAGTTATFRFRSHSSAVAKAATETAAADILIARKRIIDFCRKRIIDFSSSAVLLINERLRLG
jgi:hypothetical protein